MNKLKSIREKTGTIPTTVAPKKNRSPKSNPVFTRMWNKLVVEIESRENFKTGHLSQLEVLCDLYLEYYRLDALIEKEGYTYVVSEGRNGTQLKTRPEVVQMNRTRAEIRSYSKMLGLLLYKDTDIKDEDTKDEWD